MSYRNRLDPYWTTARRAGTDRKGNAFSEGADLFFYPRTGAVLSGEDALIAAREFEENKRIEENFASHYSSE